MDVWMHGWTGGYVLEMVVSIDRYPAVFGAITVKGGLTTSF